ncbi:hypothetical protein A9Q93_02380 [Nonlabens dokdonensis]|uniref:DUF4595 domain-containing protein n=1 Tax=Nonlabens dokdonensis TaxID=328515 RepID=A0A1Z8B9I4_9FLAO|nr:hypothetical protein [Nonlabens dokdonensis]OUS19264.1 hypothetical protein A9Q93_02380 [Nonlabens dokdonensis]
MKCFFSFLILAVAFISCDDPSLDSNSGTNQEVVEPVLDVVGLSDIQIAATTPSNVTDNIMISYDQNKLITNITFNGNQDLNYSFDYAANNRLETAVKTESNITTTYNFSYVDDTVIIESIEPSGDLRERQLYTDTQNRINRVVTRLTTTTGATSQVEDLRYQYTANFNVNRINKISENGFTIVGYSEFTYEFNNNPFRDMNDVLRILIFPDFVPYTRYLPSSRMDYTSDSNGVTLDRTFNYEYTLQEDQFPSSREITTTTSGASEISFEFFNYIP